MRREALASSEEWDLDRGAFRCAYLWIVGREDEAIHFDGFTQAEVAAIAASAALIIERH
ncbi:MAG: hypothetical protein ACREJT_00245 [Myxococcota bacterium]